MSSNNQKIINRSWSLVPAEFGETDSVHKREFILKKLKPNHVKIKVISAAMSSSDSMFIAGMIPGKPEDTKLGYDLLGIVSEVNGFDYNQLKDRFVMAQMVGGSYSEFVQLPVSMLSVIPETILSKKDYENGTIDSDKIYTIAALGLNYQTALSILQKVKKGSILFQGLSGGVGSALLDLAPSFPQIKIFGTYSPMDKSRELDENENLITYNNPNIGKYFLELKPQGFDLIVDPFGYERSKNLIPLLTKKGKILGIGCHKYKLSYYIKNQLIYALHSKREFFSIATRGKKDPKYLLDLQEKIFNLYIVGKINPLVSAAFPFDNFKNAYNHFRTSGRKGSVILY